MINELLEGGTYVTASRWLPPLISKNKCGIQITYPHYTSPRRRGKYKPYRKLHFCPKRSQPSSGESKRIWFFLPLWVSSRWVLIERSMRLFLYFWLVFKTKLLKGQVTSGSELYLFISASWKGSRQEKKGANKGKTWFPLVCVFKIQKRLKENSLLSSREKAQRFFWV